MEYLALFIPAVIGILLLIIFKKEVVWWEILIPSAVSLVFIFIFKLSVETSLVSDTEYHGNMVVEARYYEYWETWVTKTCSEQYACGTYSTGSGNNRTTHTKYCTRYYDCSYCDRNQPRWIAIDEKGRQFTISQQYFEQLTSKWSATPEFVELNRDIDYHGSCGKDGDMYRIKWDGRPESSEADVTEHSYTNKIQASHSSFKLPVVEEEQARALHLYDYPPFYNYYKQRVVLGLDSIYGAADVERIETLFQYINGYYGPKNMVKVFVCLFYDKPYSIAFKQEAYWDGGNQNEVVICIGLNKQTKKIDWVKPFSWTTNKRLMVDLREDIADLKTFKPVEIYNVVKGNIHGDIHRDFKKDFNYLTVDIPTWAEWVIYIVTLLLSLGCGLWSISNDHRNDDEIEFEKASNTHYTRYNTYNKNNWCQEYTVWSKVKKRCVYAWQELKKKQ